MKYSTHSDSPPDETPPSSSKYSTACHIFNSLLSVSSASHAWYITSSQKTVILKGFQRPFFKMGVGGLGKNVSSDIWTLRDYL